MFAASTFLSALAIPLLSIYFKGNDVVDAKVDEYLSQLVRVQFVQDN